MEMDGIKFLQICLERYKTKEEKIKWLELKERQTYNYYCDCGSNFTQEEGKEYHNDWNWIIDKLNELKQE